MSKTPNYDAAVKTIFDATQPGERTCEITGEKWLMTEEEIFWYKKFNVPPSKRAPITRLRHLACFWLSFQWWWNKHPETGKPILSFIHPASGIKVLPGKEWYQKDFVSEGRDLNVQEFLFPQLKELQLSVPYLADRNAKEPQNSIAQFSFGDVDSTFVMFCNSKRCLFSEFSFNIEDSAEILNSANITNCYNVVNSRRLNNCRFIRECFDCLNSYFLFDCRNCEFCFGATNQRNKKYLWFNEQLTKEEWEIRFAEINFHDRRVADKYFGQFEDLIVNHAVWPENFNEKAEGCVGEYLVGVSRVYQGFMCADGAHDCYWISGLTGEVFDLAFCGGAFNCNTCYYVANCERSVNLKFCDKCIDSQRLEYCLQCINCEDCFACVGLRRKRFCILNKQYIEEEYWRKIDELKCAMLERGEYGEFLPAKMAHDTYELGCAEIFYVAPKNFGQLINGKDFLPESAGAVGAELDDDEKLHDTSLIPDLLEDMTEERWKGVAFYDPIQKRRFVFTAAEVDYLKRYGIAPSKHHFITRMWDLYKTSNTGKLEPQECKKCREKITVGYNAKYPIRTVFCKACYLKYLEEKN